MTSSASGQSQSDHLTISLTYRPALDNIAAVDLLENAFVRWSVSASSSPLSSSAILPHTSRRRRHRTRLEGTDIGKLVTAVDGVPRVLSDPLFGGNVVKARGENGDTEVSGLRRVNGRHNESSLCSGMEPYT